MILTSFGTVGLVSAADAEQDSDVSTVMLDAEDFVKNVNFISGDRNTNTSASTTLLMDKNINQMADITAEYKQPAFMKFDISDYVTEGSNITGAELVWKALHTSASYVLLDVPGNDITLEYSYDDAAKKDMPKRIQVADSYFTEVKSGSALGYDGIPSDWNLKWDITDYVNGKREQGSFSLMTYIKYPSYGNLDAAAPKLRLTVAKNPIVKITAVNSDSSVESAVYDNVPFVVKATVENVTNVKSVKVIDIATNDEAGILTADGDGEYSGHVRVKGIGRHSLRVVATAQSGAEDSEDFEVEASELVKKNDIIEPSVRLNLEKGLSTPLEGDATVSSRTLERALYYTIDVSALSGAGYDVKNAWIIGAADSGSKGAALDFYRVTEDFAADGEFAEMPAYDAAAFASVTVNSLDPLTKEECGISDPNAGLYLDDAGLRIEDYNFKTDATAFVRDAAANGGKASFRVSTSDEDAEYTFTKDFAICIEYAGKNAAPTVEFTAPEDSKAFVKGNDKTVDIAFTAADDGEFDAKLYLNGKELETKENGGVYTASLDVDELAIGDYTLKAEVKDYGYDGTNGVKTATAERTFAVVKQDNRVMHKLLDAADVALVGGSLGKYNIQGDNNGSGVGYSTALLVKLDMTEIADYDIQKVEVVTDWGTQYGNYNVMAHRIYDNSKWDSNTTSFDKSGTMYDSKYTASVNYSGRTLREQGYAIDGDVYKVAFDVTSAVVSEVAGGNNVTGFLFRQINNGQRSLGNTSNPPKIYVTYTANKLPKIELISPTASALLPNTAIDIAFRVTDEDSPELGEVKAYFDGTEYPLTADGDMFTATVAADRATLGAHTLRLTASDWIGGTRTVEKTVYVSEYSVNSVEFTNAAGAKPTLKAGETINVSMNIAAAKKGGIETAVVLVLYDAYNTAKEIKFTKASIPEGGAQTVTASMVVPNINLLGARVEAFAVDGFSAMNLLAEPAELSAE